MKLALDHHYSPLIAVELRSRSHDAVAAIERGWETKDDESLLTACALENRALLTNNVGDFTVIASRWAAEGRTPAGLIFTADSSLPRTRRNIGVYVAALDESLGARPAEDALFDRVHWL